MFRSILPFVFLIAIVHVGAHAQEAPVEPPVQPMPADLPPAAAPEPTDEELHNGLRALRTEMERALNQRDLDALLENVDQNVVFTPMNGEVVRGSAGVRAYYERMLIGPDAVLKTITTTFEADDLSILHDRSTAVAFGHSSGHYELNDGSTFDVDAVWVTTILRRHGRWRIVAFSYSTNMFDNPILDAQRKYMLIGGGVGMVLVGLLAFFIGRRTARRKEVLSKG